MFLKKYPRGEFTAQAQAQELLDQRISASVTYDGAPPPTVQDLQTDIPAGWIGARADAQLTLPQLVTSLRRLESEEPYVVDPAKLRSRCKNTPFDEARMEGRVKLTLVAGKMAYEEE